MGGKQEIWQVLQKVGDRISTLENFWQGTPEFWAGQPRPYGLTERL